RAVADAFEKGGCPRGAIGFLERSPHRADIARRQGFLSVSGDATDVARLRIAGVGNAAKIIICVGDDESEAVTTAIRQASANVSVTAVLDRPSVQAAVISSGAHSVLVLSEIAGQLLAESAFLPRRDTRRD
nr:NAD-binding protein [Actinomycetota bacterium]